MAPPLLLLQNISLTLGGKPLLEGASLSVSAGERLCLVGRNGSGKSTLLNIAAGLVEPDSGTRFLQPGANVRYLPQEPDLSGYATTFAYVQAGLGPTGDRHRARTLLNALGLTGEEDAMLLSGGEARRAALARDHAGTSGTDRSETCRTCGKAERSSPENTPLGANIVQGIDILWD